MPTLCERLLSNTLTVCTLVRSFSGSTLGLTGATALRANSSVNSDRSSSGVSSICCQSIGGLGSLASVGCVVGDSRGGGGVVGGEGGGGGG